MVVVVENGPIIPCGKRTFLAYSFSVSSQRPRRPKNPPRSPQEGPRNPKEAPRQLERPPRQRQRPPRQPEGVRGQAQERPKRGISGPPLWNDPRGGRKAPKDPRGPWEALRRVHEEALKRPHETACRCQNRPMPFGKGLGSAYSLFRSAHAYSE